MEVQEAAWGETPLMPTSFGETRQYMQEMQACYSQIAQPSGDLDKYLNVAGLVKSRGVNENNSLPRLGMNTTICLYVLSTWFKAITYDRPILQSDYSVDEL